MAGWLSDWEAETFWSSCADEAAEWTFIGNYNWEGRQLQFVWESRFSCKYNENGDLELATLESDAASEATLGMDSSGVLVLTGANDEQVNPICFEPLPAADDKIKPLTEAQQTLFNDLTSSLLGMGFEAVGLIDEADDTIFTILCKGTVVYPGVEPVYYIAVMNAGRLDEEPGVTFIQLDDDGSNG